MSTIRTSVLIAEDNFLIREGLLEPLLVDQYDIVASGDDGMGAVAAAAQHRPAVALLDVSLPSARGFEIAHKILSNDPACKVVFVTNYAEAAYVQAAQDMGAAGYVLKSRAAAELIPAIESALAGTFYR